MKKIPFILIALIAVTGFTSSAQQVRNRVELSLVARYNGEEIRLRWAPSTPGAWSLLNRAGYQLERYELSREGEIINRRELSQTPVRPEPLENWRRFADSATLNEHALIAAQSIYGKKFTGDSSPMTDRWDELSNRYAFTLLSADMSFDAARAAGLGWLDSDVEKGKTYYYKLYAAAPLTDYFPVDTVAEPVSTHNVREIPKPIWLGVEENENQVLLKWDKEYNQSQFSAYYVERSSDGKEFSRLNIYPYLNPSTDLEDKPYFTFSDSVQNYVPHYYRLVGITPFGEESAASEVLRAMARDRTPPKAPFNVLAVQEGESVKVTWEVEPQTDLAGFYVARGHDALEGFVPLFDKPLGSSVRTYSDPRPLKDTITYYLVVAADTAGNATASFSTRTQQIDTLPPSPPAGLSGVIDKDGRATITWERNKEKDVKGYIVFFANQSDHDFTAAVNRVIPDTVFADSLVLWTLTEKIYYRVKAVDWKDNTSGFSEILELEKPDLVPPASPAFTEMVFEGGGVRVRWAPSPSEDVVAHRLSRREDRNNDFVELQNFPDRKNTSYTDLTVEEGKLYHYRIEAVDDAGLFSLDPHILSITIPRAEGRPGVSQLAVQEQAGQVELSWVVPPGAGSVVVYRMVGTDVFRQIGRVPSNVTKMTDKQAMAGENYQYTVRVVYPDGDTSPFSEIVRVLF